MLKVFRAEPKRCGWLCAALVAGVLLAAPVAVADTVDDIVINGTQRVDPQTVLSYLEIEPGDPFDPDLLDDSLKALFATGLFADVVVRRDGTTLVVEVKENPVINRIAFEGNDRIKDEVLEAEVQLRPRRVFTRTKVQRDVQRLLDVYRLSGRFAARVEPKVIVLEQNRVDLVFEISEGPLSRVRSITFIGNRSFSDSDLRDVIQTREYAFWRLLTSNDTYDPDRLGVDRELLRRFYLEEGYADFKVVSAVAELTTDRTDFVITFTVDEGRRYRVGAIGFDIALKQVTEEMLRPLVSFETDDWYDADAVTEAAAEMADAAGEVGYAFVDIRPRTERHREDRRIDIIFEIGEGQRVFVERIEIEGNVRTLDEVIRREVRLIEGDAFNTARLRDSHRRIRNLGFFNSVEVERQQGSAPDRMKVRVKIDERPTGELSFGVGYSSLNGLLGDVGITERNLLGRGQTLKARVQGSALSQQFDLGFVEPYFLDRDVLAGVELFRVTRDRQDDSSFDEKKTGGGVRFGYTLGRDLRQSVRYQYRRTQVLNVDTSASRFIVEQEGTTTTSQVSQSLTYDKRDNRLDPTEGYLLSMSTDVAGLGGDTRLLRLRGNGSYHFPVFDDTVLSMSAEAGHVLGLGEDVSIAERFFIGGSVIRGFAASGLGPRDTLTGDALGGNNYYAGTVEYSFPIGLPDDLGIKLALFADAGSLWHVEAEGDEVFDSTAIRLSGGFGLAWRTAFGLIRVDIAEAILKEEQDETELVRFSFGSRF